MVDGIYISATEVRISKAGADTTSTNLDDFMLHENFLALEMAIGGLINVTAFSQTIAHGLGYIPVVSCTGFYIVTTSAGVVGYLQAFASADATNVYVSSASSSGSTSGLTLNSGPSIIILGAQGG
jgi:hypothetical protein